MSSKSESLSNPETQKDSEDPYFPYKEVRPHQRYIKEFVEECFEFQIHGIIDAANGVGKTISVLSEVLKYQQDYNMENPDKPLKIFYLTRTHNQASRVIQEIREIHDRIYSQKQQIYLPKAISKRGKRAMCVNQQLLDFGEGGFSFQTQCEMYKRSKKCLWYANFVDKKDDIIKELPVLTKEPLDAEEIFDFCFPKELCPSELNNLVLQKADVIAGSYLYLFDKEIRKSILQSLDIDLDQLIIIIDECHNLPDAVLNLGSDFVTQQQLFQAINEIKTTIDDLVIPQVIIQIQQEVEHAVNSFAKKNGYEQEAILDNLLIMDILKSQDLLTKGEVAEFIATMKKAADKIKKKRVDRGDAPISHLEKVAELIEFWYENRQSKDYIVSVNKSTFGRKETIQLRIRMLSPQKLITPVLKKSHLSFSMTGTLGQPFMYKALTGLSFLDNDQLILPSPYNPKNISVLVPQGITTKWQYRSENMWQKVIAIVKGVMETSGKNGGLYVPSYQILNQLIGSGLLEQMNTISVQSFVSKVGMSSTENDKMVIEFISSGLERQSLLIGVMGGRISEGTDFAGEKMEVIFTLGVPYTPQTPEMKHRIEYFDGIFKGRGWDIVYGSPPWYKLTQAAGRGLRSLNDRVFIVAMDERILCRAKSMNNLHRLPLWMRDNIREIDEKAELIIREVKAFYE